MFKIFRVRMIYLQIIRALFIVRVVTRHALINWMSGRRMLRGFIPRKYKRNGVINSPAERLRAMIEQLGPTFIKFGQILADRPDMVSEKLRFELKKLQTSAVPFDNRYAMQLIEKELGGPIDKFFEFFDNSCIGSASIGQVYKGILIGGEEVIIKIQRPNIETKIKLDLYLMKWIASRVVKEYPGLAAMDIVGFVEEFEVTLLQELDYFNEASNAVRFAEMFREVPYCKVPKVHLDLSTRKLLIMEFIYGISPDNIDKIDTEGLDRKKIAENGTHIILRMILKHGFFHADPHAGNLFVQYDNSIAIIDFGMVGSLKPTHMNFLANFTLGLATKNARMLADALLILCGKKFFPERDDLEFSLMEMIERHGHLPYDKMNFSAILNDCIQIMVRYQLRLPSSIYLLLKSLATIEKFGYNLDPDISLPAIIRPYAEKLIHQKFSLKNIAGGIYDVAKDYLSLIRDFPGEINEILYRIKEGKLTHDIQIKDSDPFVKSAREFGRIVSIALLLGFMLAGSAIMIVWGKQVWIGHVMFAISSVFALWVFVRLFFKTKF